MGSQIPTTMFALSEGAQGAKGIGRRGSLLVPLPCAPCPLPPRKGLTLIELVVVMTLLVLLAFIAVPSFVNTAKVAQVRTAAQQLVTTLRYARAKALALGRPVLVAFDRKQRTLSVLLPADVVEQLAETAQRLSSEAQTDLTDEDWWRLAGERLEALDLNEFVVDPSPMGRKRTLPEGVEISSIRDPDTGDELNLVAFYPDGTASGAVVVLSGERLIIAVEIAPLTGTVRVQEQEPETDTTPLR
ncbi:MAG: hypothetical protein C4295_11260 [Candidatus Fervidibacterota bacterium]